MSKGLERWLRVFTALEEDTGSIPTTYIKLLTALSNSSPMGSNTLIWLPWAPSHSAYTYTQAQTHKPVFEMGQKWAHL